MASSITFTILVGGLAALVQPSANDVHVLLPEVGRSCSEQGFTPAHHSFLGYACDDWQLNCHDCEVRCSEGRCDEEPKLCWLRLERMVVRFSPYRAYGNKDREVRLRRMFPPSLPEAGNLQAVDWVPVLEDINDEYASIDTAVLDGDPFNLLQVYTSFEYSGRFSCGFASPGVSSNGRGGTEVDVDKLRVGQYAFKKPGEWTMFKHRQALATGMIYRVLSDRSWYDDEAFELTIVSLDDRTPWATLTLDKKARTARNKTKATDPVPLAFVQLIHDDEADCWDQCKKRTGGHLHALYRMTDQLPTVGEELAGYYPTRMFKDLPWDDVRRQCEGSPFLLYKNARYPEAGDRVDCVEQCGCPREPAPPAKAYRSKTYPLVIPSPGYNAPVGYRQINHVDGPPLCTPLRAEMPSPVE